MDGGLAVIADKKIPNRATPIVPPGAQSLRHMTAHWHGLPALRVGVSFGRAAPFDRADDVHAARGLVRARLLPARMYEMFGSMSDGRDSENHGGDKSAIQIVMRIGSGKHAFR